jgi:glycine betaine/proline transport system ATP-binding protein
MSAVEFDNVSIVFGDSPETALPLMDQGMTRPDIRAACDQVLGACPGLANQRCCARSTA